MVRLVASKLQPEIRLHGGADIRGPAGIDAPAAIGVLVLQDVARGFFEALLVDRAQQGVQDHVVGFERGVGFELATPIAVVVLPGEQKAAGCVGRSSDPAGYVIDFSESELGRGGGRKSGEGLVHRVLSSVNPPKRSRARWQSLPRSPAVTRNARSRA